MRVLETRIPPGETVPMHTHRWPSVAYILSWSDFIRRDADGGVSLDTRESRQTPTPEAIWSEAFPPHSVENVGTAEFHAINVETKRD